MKKVLLLLAAATLSLGSCSSDDDNATVNNMESIYSPDIRDKYQVIVYTDDYTSLDNTVILADGQQAFSACGGATLNAGQSIEILSDLDNVYVVLYFNGELTNEYTLSGTGETKEGTYQYKKCLGNEEVSITEGVLMVDSEGNRTIQL